MKRLLLILLLPVAAFSQDPAKGDNIILVKNVNFSKASSVLLDAGYTFKTKDTADQILLTELMPYPGGGLNYCIRLRVKDSTAYLSGQWKMNFQVRAGMFASDPNELMESCYRGWRTGGYRMAFSKLQEVALKLGGTVSYAKQ